MACWLVIAALSGCSVPSIATTGTSTQTQTSSPTTPAGPTTTVAASRTTAPATSAAPSTSAPSAEVTAQWLNLSFVLPSGWVVRAPNQGSPNEGCLQPAQPAPSTPNWLGCPGIWVVPATTDPAQASPPYDLPGQVWFMSAGVPHCPYPSSHPDDAVLGPGTLVQQGPRTVGGVPYRWYEWSDTCNLARTARAPVTHSFDPQVWWLPSAGMAFSDVVGHPEVTGILSSVRVVGSPPTSALNPIAHPTSGVQFHSPSGNLHCQINDGPPASGTLVLCFSADPPESAILSEGGTYTTCTGPTCLANPGSGEIELPYGQAINLGPFRCSSAFSGVTCTVNGKGFVISRSSILPA